MASRCRASGTVRRVETESAQAHGVIAARTLLEAVRPRQWVKNLLVVAVPVASGEFLHLQVLAKTGVAFVAMCLAASAVYLVNDVLDVESDRKHPVKRTRPIAAGRLSIRAAVVCAVGVGASIETIL